MTYMYHFTTLGKIVIDIAECHRIKNIGVIFKLDGLYHELSETESDIFMDLESDELDESSIHNDEMMIMMTFILKQGAT